MDYQLNIDPDAVWLLSSEEPFQSAPPYWVREVGRFTALSGFQTRRAAKAGYTLLYTLAGEGELVYHGKRHPLPAGSIAFLDCSVPYEYRITGHADWTFYFLQADQTNCDFYYNAMFRSGFHVLSCGEESGFQSEFEQIIRYLENPQTCSYSGVSHEVSTILTRLLNLYNEQQRRSTMHQNAIEETVQYIRRHYKEPIDVDFLAAKARLSKYYYIKLFKEIMHATPYEYLLGVRINEAKKLLLVTDYKSAEIGSMVGFADECNFSRTFKRLAGITPIQYRKSL